MRGLGSDHVTSGPMRGLKKTAPDGTNKQTNGHGDSMTESAQWGRFNENRYLSNMQFKSNLSSFFDKIGEF